LRAADPRLLIGTHTYAASGDAARRQSACLASLAALPRASVVDLQFAIDGHRAEGVETLAVLKKDARTVTGTEGPRKGIVSEILDALAREAASRGCRYVCFTNADIVWSQDAVDWILDSGRQAYCFSRRDIDPMTGADLGIEVSGVDAVAVDAHWWTANRRRFRDYIVGEICWDNVYTAILMCHADAAIENRAGLLRHEKHASGAIDPAFAGYIQYLTALDAGYFDRWCYYWGRLRALRERGAPLEEEQRLARESFVWRPTAAARVAQAARAVKARLRYGVFRIGIR
jgi:hypothetical protein